MLLYVLTYIYIILFSINFSGFCREPMQPCHIGKHVCGLGKFLDILGCIDPNLQILSNTFVAAGGTADKTWLLMLLMLLMLYTYVTSCYFHFFKLWFTHPGEFLQGRSGNNIRTEPLSTGQALGGVGNHLVNSNHWVT